MSLLNWGGGFAAAGQAVSDFAGKAGLEQQKADLEKQQIVLASQLKGEQYDVAAKALSLSQAQRQDLAFRRMLGDPDASSDSGSAPASGATTASAAPVPRVAVAASDDTAPSAPSGSSATSSGASTTAPSNVSPTSAVALPHSVPTITPVGSKTALGMLLPPGWTAAQAAIAGPAGLAKAWEGWSKPSDLRPGGSLNYYDFATGKEKQLIQQPNTPEGYLYDADTKSYVQIGGGLPAVAASAGAKAGATAAAELPAKKEFAGFQKGLDVATNLVDSYNPDTQTWTKVTQAEALRRAESGNGVQSIGPAGTAANGGSSGGAGKPTAGPREDGSYKTPEGTIIPPAPKIDVQGAGFQSEPSAAQKATQATYAETIKGWNDAVLPAAQTEQRMLAMADALKVIQSGAWGTMKATVAKNLAAVGFDTDAANQLMKTDAAQAQIIIKNNFGAALSTLSASKLGRITQNEIFAMKENLANPNLQPEANLAIIAQGVGVARFQQELAGGWNIAIRRGYSDPLTYQQEFLKANSIQSFIDQAQKEIGPLKGMKGAPAPGAYTWTPQGLVPQK